MLHLMPHGLVKSVIQSMDKIKDWYKAKDFADQYAIIMFAITFILIGLACA